MKNPKIKPLGDRVLVLPDGENKTGKTESGIFIPETVNKERPEQGTVIAVGPGRVDDGEVIPMTVQKGDRILFSKYGPDEIKVEDKTYLIVSESNILAIIE